LTSSLFTTSTMFSMVDVPNPHGASTKDILADCDAYMIFNMSEFIPLTLSRHGDDFFNDIDDKGVSMLMEQAISSISGATDLGKGEVKKTTLQLALRALGAKGAFENPKGPTPANSEKAQKIFTDMHYKKVYDHLNIHSAINSSVPPVEVAVTPIVTPTAKIENPTDLRLTQARQAGAGGPFDITYTKEGDKLAVPKPLPTITISGVFSGGLSSSMMNPSTIRRAT
jgi:hypothetical protein